MECSNHQTPSSEGFALPNKVLLRGLKNFGKDEKDHGSLYIRNEFREYTLEYCSNGHSRSVKIDDKTPEWYWISNCCHGLVCVYNKNNVAILIINPAIDDNFVKLPEVGISNSNCKVIDVSLCYDDQTNKYKLVRFYCSSDENGMGIEVLTLGDTAWRQVGEIGEKPASFADAPHFVSGAMHWKAYDENIFFFKASEETFGLIECPSEDTDLDEDIMLRKSSNLTVYEDCLCIVRRHWHPWKLKFFVMEDYVNRVWIEHAIDLMKMDGTPFSDGEGFDRCPKDRSIEVQMGKFLLPEDSSPSRRYSQEKFYYYNPKTESFENYVDTPQRDYQYKESFVSAQKFCNKET
ncbi:F-box protein interaction domain protein [Rhynchospora pubera]|uniref:F-box protein interaction domain protein n=1 Tax=Rhynchospora pubera TaxID=906938 RepID=A0AAV8HR96_9POAL|nr:F-box protein interaction domain protein [Rhynchospora pubera]